MRDRLYVSLGAEFNYGLYGNVQETFKNSTDIAERSTSFSGKDMAINFGIGYQFNRYKSNPITLEPSVKLYTDIGTIHGTNMIFGIKTTIFFP